MSTKSTIFLTSDNEHCYIEHTGMSDEKGNWISDTIVLEMSKKHTDLLANDDDDITVEILPNNELYDIFKNLSPKIIAVKDKFEKLGLLIDSLDNLAHALKLPLTPQLHVEQMGIHLPEKVKELKEIYVEITGENPWE